MPPLQDYLEGELTGSRFAFGGAMSIVDLILPGVFLNGRYAGYEVDARRWPRLVKYLREMWDHPLYLTRIAEEKAMLDALQRR